MSAPPILVHLFLVNENVTYKLTAGRLLITDIYGKNVSYGVIYMKSVVLSQPVPEQFIQLAENFYHLEPEVLSALVLIDFCQHPPRNLVIVETDVSFSETDSLQTPRAAA